MLTFCTISALLITISTVQAYPEIGLTAKLQADVSRGTGWQVVTGWTDTPTDLHGFYSVDGQLLADRLEIFIASSGLYYVSAAMPAYGLESGTYKAALVINNDTASDKLGLLAEQSNGPTNMTLQFSGVISLRAHEVLSIYTFSDTDTNWGVSSKATIHYHFLGRIGSTPGFLGQLDRDQTLTSTTSFQQLSPWRITARAKLFRSETGFAAANGVFSAVCTGLHMVMVNAIVSAGPGIHQLAVILDGNVTTTATLSTDKQSVFTLNVYRILAMTKDAIVRVELKSTASSAMVKTETSWSMGYLGAADPNFYEFSNTFPDDKAVTGNAWTRLSGFLSKSTTNGQFFQPINLVLNDGTKFFGQNTDLYYVMVNLEIEGNATMVEAMTAINAPANNIMGDEGIYGVLSKPANQAGSVSMAAILHLRALQQLEVLVRVVEGDSLTIKARSSISIVRTRYILSSFTARTTQSEAVQVVGWQELTKNWGADIRGLYIFGNDFSAATGKFTASHTGVHIVSAHVNFVNAETVASTIAMQVCVNGIREDRQGLMAVNGNPSSFITLRVHGSVLLRAGDFVSVYHYSSADNDYTIAQNSTFSVTYIGPAWAANGVHAMYSRTLGFSNVANSAFELTDMVTSRSGVNTIFNNDNRFQNGRYTSSEDALYFVSANIHVYNISQATATQYSVHLILDSDSSKVGGSMAGTQPSFLPALQGRDFATISVVFPVRLLANQRVSLFFRTTTNNYFQIGTDSDMSVIKWSSSTYPPSVGFAAVTPSGFSGSGGTSVTSLDSLSTDPASAPGLFYVGPQNSLFLNGNAKYKVLQAGVYYVTIDITISKGDSTRFSIVVRVQEVILPIQTIEASPRGSVFSLSFGAPIYVTADQEIAVGILTEKSSYEVDAGSSTGLILLQLDESNPGFATDKREPAFAVDSSRQITNWGGTSKPGLHVSNIGLFTPVGSYTTKVAGIYINSFNGIIRNAPSAEVSIDSYLLKTSQDVSVASSSLGRTRTPLAARLSYLDANEIIGLRVNTSTPLNISSFDAGWSLYFYDRQTRITGLSNVLGAETPIGASWTVASTWINDSASFASGVDSTARDYVATTSGSHLVMFSAHMTAISGQTDAAVFIDEAPYLMARVDDTPTVALPITGVIRLNQGQKVSFRARAATGSPVLQKDTTRSVLLINQIFSNTNGFSAKAASDLSLSSGVNVLTSWDTSVTGSFIANTTLATNGFIIIQQAGIYHVSANVIIENTAASDSTFEAYVNVDTESVSPYNLRSEKFIRGQKTATLTLSSSVQLQRFSALRLHVNRPDNQTYVVKNTTTFSIILVDDNVGPSICDDSDLHVQRFVNTFIRISTDKSVSLTCNVLGFYPVTYAWYKNDSLLPGITTSILTISPTVLNDTGEYRCQVSYENLRDQTNNVVVQVYDPTPTVMPTQSYSIAVKEGSLIGTEIQQFLVSAVKFAPGPALVRLVITGGDPNGHFTFTNASTTLVTLTTTSVLDYETIPFYSLLITAVNMDEADAKNRTIRFNITLVDINDNAPKFDLERYVVSVPENLTVNSHVVQMNATDRDAGINGLIKYAILGKNALPWFAINESTGWITLISALDRENRDRHVIAVTASDPTLVTVVEVVIFVTDVNDNAPIFTNNTYNFSIVENFPVSQSILQVYATDRDIGINAQITYQILTPNIASTFTLRGANGILTLASPLDRERQGSYSFVIRATDNGVPSLFSNPDVQVNIEILDVNDNAPGFPSSLYTVVVSEDVPVGHFVLNLNATDNDATSINNMIRYNITDSLAAEYFGIDPLTGMITVSKALDYELYSSFYFTVTGTDTGNPNILRTTNVLVTIRNVNDETPILSPLTYNLTVSEYSPIGFSILKVNATDRDGSLTSLTFIEKNGPWADFILGADTGDILLRRLLDREVLSQYTLEVTVNDGIRNATQPVIITILVGDENDNTPVFSQSEYSVEVLETTAVGTSLLQVNATDVDLGVNSEIVYSILTSNQNPSSSMFSIENTTGVITLRQPLDFELNQVHHFVVMASDQGRLPKRSAVHVRVIVRDVNDNRPTFEQQTYSASVLESAPVGTLITQVSAKDNDTSPTITITYSIVSGNIGNSFAVDANGFVYLMSPLNYETRQMYNLTISANDGLFTTSPNATLLVNVLEVNDNRPVPMQTYYTAMVSEDTSVGTFVLQIVANDADLGTNNSMIRYVALDNTTAFSIDLLSGNITVSRPLDYETKSSYHLVATIQDLGSPHLSSRVLVDIMITDVNDNPPIFSQDSYNVTIAELTPLSTSVLKIIATDKDNGQAGTVIYQIIDDGTNGGTFSVNSNSGDVIVAKLLDFESRRNYSFQCVALDRGNPQMSSANNVTITIFIADNNDNQAIFVTDPYDISIPESTPVNSIVVTVLAIDGDGTHPNRNLSYFAVNSRDSGNFTVLSNGTVLSVESFDYESIVKYSFEVEARDSGTNQLRSRVLVIVRITDVNDNAPLLTQSNYTLNVSEGTLVGSQIITIVGTDRDSGQNGALSYTILTITPAADFAIGTDDGVLRSTNTLNFVTRPTYLITVRVSDKGNPVRFTTAFITVNVRQVTIDGLTFEKSLYTFQVVENRFTNPIGSIKAIDTGNYTSVSISYEIQSSSHPPEGLIHLNTVTGILYMNITFNYEETPRLDYGVVARNERGAIAYSHVTIFILDVNEPPFFIGTSADGMYHCNVTETNVVGGVACAVHGRDNDTGINGELMYGIQNSTDAGYFQIDSYGQLKVMSAIDYEKTTTLSLNVSVTDKGSPALNAFVIVLIRVIDVNDNAPTFIPSSRINITANESMVAGTVLGSVNTQDIDGTSPNNLVQYTIVPSGYLTIASNGSISIASAFDYESRQELSFTIIATDLGTPSRSTVHPLHLTILNANDNEPYFNTTFFNISVIETAQVGTEIITVRARDNDLENFGNIAYYEIVSGSNGMFNISSNGVVALTGSLSYALQPHYSLTIVAVDGGNRRSSVPVTVIINVIDASLMEPFFTLSGYYVTIRENNAIGVGIVKVEATSNERVHGPMIYSLVTSNDSVSFTINSVTGQINASISFDYETQRFFTFHVEARDSFNDKTVRTLVSVTVLDVNDNTPIISTDRLAFNVSEATLLGATVGFLRASDQDDGVNKEIVFSLIGGDGNGVFTVGELGHILLVGAVSANIKPSYTLIVQAEDRGTPRLRSNVTVTITILPADITTVNVPLFNPSIYVRTVNENVIVPNLLQVFANHTNPVSSSRLVFTMEGSKRETEPFTIDSATGNISINVGLDYEVKRQYNFLVVATNEIMRRDFATVTVLVLDVNDNRPVFVPSFYNTTISELNQVGYALLKVSVTDADTPAVNQALSFTITSGNNMGYFRIMNSGQLEVNRTLDYEAISNNTMTLTVSVSEGGVPSPSTATVQIIVVDENDNHPSCAMPEYNFTVFENSTSGFSIGTIRARDNDRTNPNNAFFYEIATNYSAFTISTQGQDGVIQLANPVDYETQRSFTVIVVVKDRGSPHLLGTCLAHISILDSNDNVPVFDQASYHNNVSEAATTETIIITVRATDKDSGLGGSITYSLDNGTNLFSIDSMGNIRLTTRVDYEGITRYVLVARATDGYGQSSTVPVVIDVINVNDNQPTFTSGTYVFTLNENFLLGGLIGRVEASDRDRVGNSITYTIVPNEDSGNFSLNGTGFLASQTNFDYEAYTKYSFLVKASDSGSPTIDGYAHVIVWIRDVNDNPPLISGAFHERNVSDVAPIGTVIIVLSASDRDSGDNGRFQWTIVEGNNDAKFIIDNMGAIRMAGLLTAPKTYNLTVMTTDFGVPSLSSRTTVLIRVIPSETNRPVFSPAHYERTVPENTALSSVIVTLNLTSSMPSNPLPTTIDFHVSTRFGEFAINNATRTITLASMLNYERQRRYDLIVIATNTDSFSATATVTVFVTNVNEHAPYFLQSLYNVTISELVYLGHTVIKLEGNDTDTGMVGLQYAIVNGNEDGNFRMSGANILVLKKPFVKSVYMLNVSVTDPGSLKGYTTVIINILPENAPKCTNAVYYVNLQENITVSSSILTVSAGSATRGIMYSLHGSAVTGRFSINRNTGVITLLQGLNYEMQKQYIFTVMAQVNMPITLVTACSVVVNVVNVHDVPPMFELGNYRLNVTEDHPVNSFIFTLNVVNRDVSTPLKFTILSGNVGFAFGITEMGDLFVNNSLNYDTIKMYTLTVQVFDGLFTATTTVIIDVIETPKCNPVFVSALYVKKIPETTSVRTLVETVKIRNETAGLTYSISGDDSTAFSIDPSSGEIRTKTTFNFDIKRVYVFRTQATIQQRSGFSAVVVEIEDVNNMQPLVPNQNYNRTLYESAPIGSQVAHINATRRDTVPADLKYTIVAGNGDQIFSVNNIGSVVLSKSLDYETSKRHDLQVNVEDGSFSVLVSVTVNVLDIQETFSCLPCPTAAPCPQCTTQSRYQFTKPLYETTVAEDQALNNTIVTVALNIGVDRQFSIVEEPMKQIFDIHPILGQIRLKSGLDYETAPFHIFTVEAKGLPCLNLTTVVLVRVTDLNDNCPSVSAMTQTVSLSQPLEQGTIIAILDIKDNDTAGADTRAVSISNGNINNRFSVDRFGVVRATTGIVENRNLTYNLEISVTDGTCAVKSNITVHLRAPGSNTVCSQPCSSYQFTLGLYERSFSESISLSTLLLTVGVQGATPLNYSIDEAAARTYFQIGALSGEIRLIKQLDFEVQRVHYLTVRARFSEFSTTAVVMINVQDVNDECPDFTSSSLTVSHADPVRNGLLVAMVPASDKDTVGTLTYSIFSDPAGNFRTDSSGNIYSNRVISNANTTVYNIILMVSDGVCSKNASVTITTLKIGSCPVCPGCPNVTGFMFTSAAYQLSVREDAAVGSILTTARVHDSQMVTYSIIEANAASFFLVNSSTGIITLKQALDYETQRQHIFTVLATFSGSVTSRSTVVVNVQDVDDTAPLITFSLPVIVSEGSGPGDVVTCITATDSDTTGALQYRIIGGNDGITFNITSTGQIIVNRKLNRQSMITYNLTIEVSDGTHKTVRSLIVTVSPSGNFPSFTNSSYTGQVPEDATTSYSILKVTATAANSTSGITYSIAEANARTLFRIDSATGVVYLNGTVDYETITSHQFTVVATDSNGLSSSVPVTVNVVNVNDNTPVFNPSTYTVNVHEFTIANTAIVTLRATDADNDPLSYSIISGNTNSVFAISNAGVITISSALSMRNENAYTLTVRVEDTGGKTQTATVTVNVIRTNANQAGCNYFGNHTFQVIAVYENATVNTTLYIPPGSSQRQLVFFIDNTEARHFFNINSVTGAITLNSLLDYETQRSHIILVRVRDPITNIDSFSYLQVNVGNVDDNVLSFSGAPYTASVPEVSQPGTYVIQITANDADMPGGLTYRIVSGNGNGIFTIDPSSGIIRVSGVLNYQVQQSHNLTVCAVDSRTNASVCTNVVINAQNNNNFPTFSSPSSIIVITKNTTNDTVLVDLNVTSPDGGSITFSIPDDQARNHFSVDSNGRVRLINSSGLSLPISFFVCATRQGPPQVSSCTVVYARSGGQNTFSPVFVRSVYGRELLRSHPISYLIETVTANDQDTGLNGQVKYRITAGNQDGYFALNENDGSLTLAKALMNATSKLFELTVEARDLGSPSFTATVQVLLGLIPKSPDGATVLAIRSFEIDVSLSKTPFEISRVRYYYVIVQKYDANAVSGIPNEQPPTTWRAVYYNINSNEYSPYITLRVSGPAAKRRRRSINAQSNDFLNVTVGNDPDKNCETKGNEICNGPLTPASQYRFALYAYYVDGVAVRGPWSEPSSATPTTPSAATQPLVSTFVETYWIIGLIIMGTLFVLAVLAIAILLCYKRRMFHLEVPIAYTNPTFDDEDGPPPIEKKENDYGTRKDVEYANVDTIRQKKLETYAEKARETQQTSFAFVEAEEKTLTIGTIEYETISADIKFDQELPQWQSMDIQLKIDPTGKLDPVISKRDIADSQIGYKSRKGSDSSSSSDSIAKKSKKSSSRSSTHSSAYGQQDDDLHDYDQVEFGNTFADVEDVVVTTDEPGATRMTVITTSTTTTVSQDPRVRVYVDAEKDEDATQL